MSKTTEKISPEGCERAVRLVLDHEGQHGSRWQAVMSICKSGRPWKADCPAARVRNETLRATRQ